MDFLFCALFILLHHISLTNGRNRVLCYYGNWNVNRNEEYRLLPKDIDARLCTHLMYAFAMPDLKDGIVPLDFLNDFTSGGDLEFVALKKDNPSLVLSLSIGGWEEGSVRFSRIISDPEKRTWFARYSYSFIRSVGFDAFDINWQWPGVRHGSSSADKANFVEFIKEIKTYYTETAKKSNMTYMPLTLVVPSEKDILDKGFDIQKLDPYIDFFSVLTMDYHSSTEPAVNHPSPLYTDPKDPLLGKLSVDASINMFLNTGVKRSKVILGIPTYGRSFVLDSAAETEMGSLAEEEGMPGFGTKERGTLAFYEICTYIRRDGWRVKHPNDTVMGPYAYHNRNWVGYDDAQIIRKKVEYARDKKLGGVMFWTIDQDDFKGYCGEKYPMTRIGRSVLNEDLEDEEDKGEDKGTGESIQEKIPDESFIEGLSVDLEGEDGQVATSRKPPTTAATVETTLPPSAPTSVLPTLSPTTFKSFPPSIPTFSPVQTSTNIYPSPPMDVLQRPASYIINSERDVILNNFFYQINHNYFYNPNKN